ncbi:box C/D snoRNA protein 1 isoform X1 [Strongylocentrotus purpuratus]|uniref:HIT-type domain-containing protein n=1 Tax=Strongylocentrotus purpuratus TaxID=7668 RepID=A0A7M7T4V1_STRPU|nr:box C/D snoRNA protein 1 isoform X1 [Strongylocentrotus purpuratus]
MGTAEGDNLSPLIPIPTKNVDKKCEMCEQDSSKYTCPRCQMKTCCLSCVKNHKSQRGCSGVRDKTPYVPIKEFTENHLLNDYRLLEDMDRKRYAANGDVKNKPGYLNFRWKLVSKKAADRGVRLRLLPHFFSKHKENSTTFIKKTKLIAWHVKWIFPKSSAEFTDTRLSEEVILREALDKYLHPDRADPVIRQRLKKYCSKGIDDVEVYMKVEDKPANTVRYYSLALDKTLGANLKGKIIVEYPTFHVTLRDDTEQYQLLDHEKMDQSRVAVENNSQSVNTLEQEKEDGEDEGPPEETTSHQIDDAKSQSVNTVEKEMEDGEDETPPEETTSHQIDDAKLQSVSTVEQGMEDEEDETPPEETTSRQIDDLKPQSLSTMEQERKDGDADEGLPEEISSHKMNNTR